MRRDFPKFYSSMCVCEREKECVCERVGVCVCERESDCVWERSECVCERVCVCVCERERECVSVCVCVCVSENECVRECVSVCERERVRARVCAWDFLSAWFTKTSKQQFLRHYKKILHRYFIKYINCILWTKALQDTVGLHGRFYPLIQM